MAKTSTPSSALYLLYYSVLQFINLLYCIVLFCIRRGARTRSAFPSTHLVVSYYLLTRPRFIQVALLPGRSIAQLVEFHYNPRCQPQPQLKHNHNPQLKHRCALLTVRSIAQLVEFYYLIRGGLARREPV